MPEDLAAVLPDRHGAGVSGALPGRDVFTGKSNNPPKDYAKWGELARVVTAHLVERYGQAEVATGTSRCGTNRHRVLARHARRLLEAVRLRRRGCAGGAAGGEGGRAGDDESGRRECQPFLPTF